MARSRIIALENFQQFTAIHVLSDPGALPGKQVIPNGIMVRLDWSLVDGKTAHNVLCGVAAGGFTPTPAIAEAGRAALVTGAAWTTLAGFFATQTQLAAVTLRDLRVIDQPFISSTGAATPGTSASTALPSESALVITIRTAKVGQAGRGRIYIPGWATNAIGTQDTVAAAAVTALQNWTTNIFNCFAAMSLTPALRLPARNAYTGSTGTAHPARTAGTQNWTQLLVRDNHWDSQRRRGLR